MRFPYRLVLQRGAIAATNCSSTQQTITSIISTIGFSSSRRVFFTSSAASGGVTKLLQPRRPSTIRNVGTTPRNNKTTTTTTAAAGSDVVVVLHHHQEQPPLPVRVALVSAVTALCTPAFPAIGFVNLCLRVAVPDPQLRSALAGSWGTIFSFATWTLLPALYNVAPLLLPFAVGNGVVAGAAYAVTDVASGGPNSRVLRNPLSGAAIGAFTAYVAPVVCYGPAFAWFYGSSGSGIEETSQVFRTIMNLPLVTQVSVLTGVVGGLALYPLLRFPMYGIRGVDWKYFSGPIFLASAAGIVYMYTPDERLDVPDGSFVEPSTIPLLESILRYNTGTGELGAYSLEAEKWLGPPELCEKGRMLADSIRSYDGITVDDRILAWVNSHWMFGNQQGVMSKDRVVTVKSSASIQGTENSMLQTDGVVAFIIERARQDSKPVSSSVVSSKTHQDLLQLVNKMDALNHRKQTTQMQHRKILTIEAASIAAEFLVALKKCSSNGHAIADLEAGQAAELLKELEASIRRKSPAIVLFADEEQICGESVESQLESLGWKCENIEDAKARWKAVDDSDNENDRREKLRLAGVFVLSLAGLFFFF